MLVASGSSDAEAVSVLSSPPHAAFGSSDDEPALPPTPLSTIFRLYRASFLVPNARSNVRTLCAVAPRLPITRPRSSGSTVSSSSTPFSSIRRSTTTASGLVTNDLITNSTNCWSILTSFSLILVTYHYQYSKISWRWTRIIIIYCCRVSLRFFSFSFFSWSFFS